MGNLYKKKQKALAFVEFTEDDEADVEDLFSVEFYLRLVNGEFECEIRLIELVVGRPRVRRRIEDHLMANPLPREVHFSHYRPARYFSENAKLLAEHSGDEDVDRLKRFSKRSIRYCRRKFCT